MCHCICRCVERERERDEWEIGSLTESNSVDSMYELVGDLGENTRPVLEALSPGWAGGWQRGREGERER